MKFEFFISKRLRVGALDSEGSHSSPILSIVLAGIVIALVIMILSLTIIFGFKEEINKKIYSLDSHIRILSEKIDTEGKVLPISIAEFESDSIKSSIADYSIDLIAEKQGIFKTPNDFQGIVLRGLTPNADTNYLKNTLIEGKLPNLDSIGSNTEIIISKQIANQLRLKTNDKVLIYFIDEKIKVRNLKIVGIYNTDFNEFDKNIAIGNINLIQGVNLWDNNEGNYISLTTSDVNEIAPIANNLINAVTAQSFKNNEFPKYKIVTTQEKNLQYFAWLDLLDMNVVVIIILMSIVSAFTLIAGLLIIVLGRINMIGILKALGATNYSIRNIFILLTQKLIFKAIIWGNIIGITLALIQKYLHIIKLDPESYYMPYVPISFNIFALILLNIGVVIVAYITLLAPSYIISTIKPSKSLKFD